MKTKDELLDHYASKEPKRFLQIDGFHWPGDDFADEEGDSTSYGPTVELMDGTWDVRLLIGEDADPEAVRRLLVKALNVLDHGFEAMREQEARELFARAGIFEELPF